MKTLTSLAAVLALSLAIDGIASAFPIRIQDNGTPDSVIKSRINNPQPAQATVPPAPNAISTAPQIPTPSSPGTARPGTPQYDNQQPMPATPGTPGPNSPGMTPPGTSQYGNQPSQPQQPSTPNTPGIVVPSMPAAH